MKNKERVLIILGIIVLILIIGVILTSRFETTGNTIYTISCDLSAYAGTQNDASTTIQACITNAGNGGTVELPAGRYYVSKQLVINNPIKIKTQGKTQSDAKCQISDSGCAEIIAKQDFNDNNGIILINPSEKVSIDHVIINGNKAERGGTAAAQRCKAALNSAGVNIHVYYCDGCSFTNMVSKNALCGTGMGGIFNNTLIMKNTITSNGIHSADSLFSDGLTAISFDNSSLIGNEFSDNTDIDLILGGGKNAVIRDNWIWHTNNFIGASMGALLLFNWNDAQHTSTGDFSGAEVYNNNIDCGSAKRCGFGMYIGARAWNLDVDVIGAKIHDNKIQSAQQGVAIDGKNIKFYNNQVTGSGGIFKSGAVSKVAVGFMTMGKYNIAPGSSVDRSGDSVSSSDYTSRAWVDSVPSWPIWSVGYLEDLEQSDFVKTAYLHLLERGVDQVGKDWASNNLDLTINRLDYLAAFYDSAELQTKYGLVGKNNSDFVESLYSQLLKRQSDSARSYWINLLNSGTSRRDLFKQILNTTEFKDKFTNTLVTLVNPSTPLPQPVITPLNSCNENNVCESGETRENCPDDCRCNLDSDCTDGNPCTTDACVNHACNYVNNQNSCSDGNSCTMNDVCNNGACSGTLLNCNDNDPCTTDSCTNGFCQYAFSQGFGCSCQSDLDCFDNNLCTDDSCINHVCANTANTFSCSDNNACTTNDLCSAGICSGTVLDCNDNLSCTLDSCSNGVCLHNSVGCVCTSDADCNDSNLCTNNFCNTTTKTCGQTYNAVACDDDHANTINDFCREGSCIGESICNLNNLCEESRGEGCGNCANDCGSCFVPDSGGGSPLSENASPSSSQIRRGMANNSSTNISVMKEPRQIKEIPAMKYLIAGVILGILLVVLLIIYYLRKNKQKSL